MSMVGASRRAARSAVLPVSVGLCALGTLAVPAGAAPTGAALPTLAAPRLAFDADVPDPSVLEVGSTTYVYSTNVTDQRVPVMSSTDLVHWHQLGDAMAFLPAWASDAFGFSWAPDVAVDPAGGYQLFFDALDRATGTLCIGRATAPGPAGPFVDTSAAPLVCPPGGAIDPDLFTQGPVAELLWKSDGEQGQPQALWGQPLDAADRTLTGHPTELLAASAPWEDGIVEGPDLVDLDGHLDLLFSAGRWDTATYTLGVAACAGPLGPCDAAAAAPLLEHGSGFSGAGGPSAFDDHGTETVAFAAWSGDRVTGGHRALYLADLVGATDDAAHDTAALVAPATPGHRP